MLSTSGDVEVAPRHQFDHLVLELEAGGTLKDQDPFVFSLVVPEAIWRPVAGADDPLNPDAVAFLKNVGEFFGEGGVNVEANILAHPLTPLTILTVAILGSNSSGDCLLHSL